MTSTETQVADTPIQPANRITGLSPYQPPAKSPFIEITLDANEGQACKAALETVSASLSEDVIQRYPSTTELEIAVASIYSIDPARVVVTNGADDAIDRVCRAVLEPGREVVIHQPTFEMIERSARLAGADCRSVSWLGGAFPIDNFVDAITTATSLVAIVSPNNPTGGTVSLPNLLKVARAAKRVGSLVLVDLAYIEFADEDPTNDLLEEPNVVVIRTFSKAMGLAGARVGYAMAAPEVVGWLRTVGGPYPVSSVSAALAAASLATRTEQSAYIRTVRSERYELIAALREYGCSVLESEANFVTARFADSVFVKDALAALGVSVRAFESRPELAGCLRITLPGDQQIFKRLLRALQTIMTPEAILFDLDGVLADVSDSYRKTIIETARTFAVSVTSEDIEQAKRAGDANNDWLLTAKLIQNRGVPCEINDVVNRFQRLYEGTDDSEGLRESERLIPNRSFLERLASRFTLGIVTGRPRDEAEWFLKRAGIREAFKTLVCMEDAPAKPSPAPVQAAMQKLGVQCAWMIGDTPDDMTSARKAVVLPIGVTAPCDNAIQMRESLYQSGAAAILDDVSQIERMVQ